VIDRIGFTYSPVAYRVGVKVNLGDPQFGTEGFNDAYLDRNTPNQVRHFIGGFAVGYRYGRTVGRLYAYALEFPRAMTSADPDIALSLKATQLGASFDGDFSQLSQVIRTQVCK
jgi:hypothetical protein